MTTIYFEQIGSGPDLVLIHGWGLHGGIWQPLAETLADSYRVTTVDLPGHGRSPGEPADITLETMADSLVRLINVPAIWLGWSLGAMVAMTLAFRHPQAVKKLILVAATPKFVIGPNWPVGMAVDTLAGFKKGLADDYRATLDSFLGLQIGSGKGARELIRRLRAVIFQHGEPVRHALEQGLQLLQDSDLRQQAATISAPVYLLHGGRDRITPPLAAESLTKMLPHAELTVIADAGHAPFLSHPEIFYSKLHDFLDKPA